MRKSILGALALALAALGPAGCGETPEQPSGDPSAPEGISVTDGRLVLPAVSGNPGAIYFDISNAGDRDIMIRAVSVPGAGSAVMHMTATWSHEVDMQEITQQPVKAGETVKFEPGGLHVMVMDIAGTVAPGSEAEATLTFVGGDKVSFPVQVLAAGDAR